MKWTMPHIKGDNGRKKILFLTGTRADFGKIKSLINEVKNSSDFDYSIFVTGMHMLSRYGATYAEILSAGFENIYLYINQDSSINSQMDMVLGNTITGLGNYIREFPPDVIIVHGDRVEALAGAIVGVMNNILVAHIEGGEVSGTVDESIRHAVSKLAHIHFVANDSARDRLIQMGEAQGSIYVIGSPDIDVMLSPNLPGISKAKERYEIDFDEYLVLIYHPVVTELKLTGDHVNMLLNALEKSSHNYVVIYPNNDAGSEIIMEAFKRIEGNPRFRIIPSVRFEYFLTLMKNARAVIGNSSSGVREAPAYGIPSINIGTRQMNRFHYESIINVKDDENDITQVLINLPERSKPSFHFGEGDSGAKFIKALNSESLWKIPHQKSFRNRPF